MKVILIHRNHGGSRSIELGRWSRALLSLCCLGLPLGMIALGFVAGQESQARDVRDNSLDTLQDELAAQSTELDDLRLDAELKLQAMTMGLAELQARLTRLDALGDPLTVMANLEDGEFDFSQPPGMGGPLGGEFNVEYLAPDLTGELQSFAERLDQREQQLEILEDKPHPAGAQPCPAVLVEIGKRLAEELQGAAAGCVQPGQQSQQGRLAHTALPEDRYALAGEHREAKTTQNGELPFATLDLLEKLVGV
jgi:hypothetical protein